MDPEDAQTEAAILTIISWLEAGDSIPAILEEILVNAVEGFDLGPYAKDLEINDGFVGKQLREFLVVKRCEVSGTTSARQGIESTACKLTSNWMGDDLLPWLVPKGVSGDSRCMAWQYGGGNSLAGCHREDANLHFVHLMPMLSMDISGLQEGCTMERIATLAMDHRLQSKIWLFMCSRDTNDVILLNKEMACLDDDILEDMLDAIGDDLFKGKLYVIKPDWARLNGWQMVSMCPGDIICSDYPHAVCGGTASVLSVAWNTCQLSNLTKYLQKSYELSEHRRKQQKAMVAMDIMRMISLNKAASKFGGVEIAHALMNLHVLGDTGVAIIQDITAARRKLGFVESEQAVRQALLHAKTAILTNKKCLSLPSSLLSALPQKSSQLLSTRIVVTNLRCFSLRMPLSNTLYLRSLKDCQASSRHYCGHCIEQDFNRNQSPVKVHTFLLKHLKNM
ncbi:hypothetical protein CEUSTIGMA_g13332.t1 [Chlamydomonas eustigma]|uniref:Uncharacterized protein n=1 Tax=Chlamydomonas eustigma TaxID=1157962 RepID=A0A250XS98_9CHLO|nr:hypothetical protein CEUSTIGMA_g13332.t1 [Chlamydomonas eustigma]|eukprot:GAX85916.1 hypothetical protein CEUSTIGMA_g13332.t1 [Chlamydomonas eustigma]